MIRVAKEAVIQHLTMEDFDAMADLLLTKVGHTFLDKALARRLETIPARQLVNALARAERLGYDVQDIIEEGQGGGEHVIPSLHSLAIPPQPVPSHRVPSQAHPPPVHPPPPHQPVHQPPASAQNVESVAENDARYAPVRNGPGKVMFCQCGWPCSSSEALEYVSSTRWANVSMNNFCSI